MSEDLVGGRTGSDNAIRAALQRAVTTIPVTRVHNVTPLGIAGLPVYAAITPLAADLKVHSGRGLTKDAAKTGAVMEAVERACAEGIDKRRVQYGTERALERTHRIMRPSTLDLPYGCRYSNETPIHWVEASDLICGDRVLVPLDAVVSPPRGELFNHVETNGLAAGENIEAASLHGLYELLERDALSEDLFRLYHGSGLKSVPSANRIVAPAIWPQAVSRLTSHAEERCGLRTIVREISNDLAVPTYSAQVLDTHFPGSEGESLLFLGAAAGSDPAVVIMRAVLEAFQSHTLMWASARDDFEGLRPSPEPQDFLHRRLRQLAASPDVFRLPRPIRSDCTSRGELAAVLEILRSCGFKSCAVVDLTDPRIGVTVVRVVVPGLAMPYGDTARRPNRRLLAGLLWSGS